MLLLNRLAKIYYDLRSSFRPQTCHQLTNNALD